MHFKEEFFNLYKIMPLQCRPQNQDEDAPAFASCKGELRTGQDKPESLCFP